MDGRSRSGKTRDFIALRDGWSSGGSHGRNWDRSEGGKDAALELTLGPPGKETRGEPCKEKGNQGAARHFLSLSTTTPAGIEESPARCPEMVIRQEQKQEEEEEDGERKSPPPVDTAVQNTQKRCAPAAVVGWPPIRSFRRNIAGSSGVKQQPGPDTRVVVSKETVVDKQPNVQSKGLFVKINMDGVPIGRKVDLKSCESYEKLATAVDELFCSLLAAAQTDSSRHEPEKPITGLLDGTGVYTLVYEDDEGDRMLVGDVPWQMFVATAKRLRVLKRSDLSVITLGGRKQDNKSSPESAAK